jgi:hypothetical protein
LNRAVVVLAKQLSLIRRLDALIYCEISGLTVFWRRRFFKRQYFVAISLFGNIELARQAQVDYYVRTFGPLYAIRCGMDGGHKQLGWAFVSEHASATAAWNDKMRDKGLSFSIWQDGRLFNFWPDQAAPPKEKLDDVQLCVVFEAYTKYTREAANDAWNKLLSGHPAHIEWYDASSDRKWTKMFRPSTLSASPSQSIS